VGVAAVIVDSDDDEEPVNGIGAQLVLIAVLLLVNAVLSGSEIALISLRPTQVDRLSTANRAGRTVAKLTSDPNRFLATIQIGITLSGFLASATAAVILAEPLVEPLTPFLGGAARGVAITTITALLTFVTLVVAELTPKRIAMRRAERWALLVARPIDVLATLATPLIAVLSWSTDGLVRLAGLDPGVARETGDDREIRELIAARGIVPERQQQLLLGVFEAEERQLRQIVVPRREVLALREDQPVPEALATLVAAGHSRAPVFREELDDADRMVSALALASGAGTTVGEVAVDVPVLPESLSVLRALEQLQGHRRQLALVVSEHGGFEGIVTVEDLVEEIVGEIHDELDADLRDVTRRADGSVVVVGGFPVHDLTDLGIDLDVDTEAATVGGLVTERLGRLPRRGDEVAIAGHAFRVEAVAHRAVARVTIGPRS
jgi:putative hemolysin